MSSDQQNSGLGLQGKTVLGSRLAAIMLSCISVICSLIVVVSYIRMLRRFRAHQRKIIEASMAPGGSNGIDHLPLSAAAVANGVAATCFSCESSLATPCVSKSFFYGNSINNPQPNVSNSNGRFNQAAPTLAPASVSMANGAVGVGIGMTPQNVLLQFRESSINNSSGNDSATGAAATTTSAVVAPASMHRSSMPPLPHMPLSVDSKHKATEGSRATSLDRIYGAYGRLSSGKAKSKQQRFSNGQQVSVFPATLDVVASAPASAASASASVSAPLSTSFAEPGVHDGCSNDQKAASQQQQQQQQHAEVAVALSSAEAGSNAKPQHADAPWPQQNRSSNWSWPWAWSRWWRRAGVFGRRHRSSSSSSSRKGTAQGKPTLDIFGRSRRRRKLPRIPSSKIAVLSGIDLLMHALWIVNTTTAKTQGSCTATFFFYHWIQLFYLFFLASFVSRSAMRLRNLQPIQPHKQRRTDMIYCASTLAASLVLSLIPAVMYGSSYDSRLGACWFESDSSIAIRWLWMSLNTWVVISLVFLIANSVYVAIILSNERRDLLNFIAHPLGPQGSDGQRMRPEDMHHSSLHVAPSATAAAAATTATSAMAVPGVLKPERLGVSIPKQYYYAGNHHHTVVSSNRMTLVANDHKVRSSQRNVFGTKPTSVTSRESLAIHLVPGNADKQESRRLSSYPSTHPVALAHEALHGRRPVAATSSTRNSIPVGVCFACSGGRGSSSNYAFNSGIPGPCEVCKQGGSRRSSSHGSRHNSDILQYGVASYVFGRTAQWATGSNSSRCSGSSHSHSHSHSNRYSGGNSINMPMGASRPESTGPDKTHAATRASARMYVAAAAAAATPSLALVVNDSDSSRICAPQPWDSSRRLLHKHSYGSSITTPAESIAASDRRPLYGFYAQKPVNRRESGHKDEGGKRRAPKHMSMPVAAHGSGCRRVSVAAAAAAAIQRHSSRRQSALSDDVDWDPHHRHFSIHNPYGIRYQQAQHQYQQQHLRRQHKRGHCSMDPRLLETAMAGRNARMPSIHEDIVRTDEDSDGSNLHCDSDFHGCAGGTHATEIQPTLLGLGSGTTPADPNIPPTRAAQMASAGVSEPVLGQQTSAAYLTGPAQSSAVAEAVQSLSARAAAAIVASKQPATSGQGHGRKHGGLSGAFSGFFRRMRCSAIDGRQKSHGQIQRIERRVHTLVATGALRVATRAMVPLVTQLCMVIWSTTHSLLPEPAIRDGSGDSSDSVLYSVAILLLSLQGILDMALYFIYDTHSDASEVSLPTSAYPMLASSHHVNTIHGGIYGSKSPGGNYAQTHQPSLLHLHGDVYYSGSYTPRGSQDAHAHPVHYYPHGLRHWGSAPRQTPNHYRRSNSFASANSNGSNLSAGAAAGNNNAGHMGGYGIASSSGGNGNGNSSGGGGGLGNIFLSGNRSANVATGASTATSDRKFAFNLDSLNIRRVDRTSNAMQSDTLHGSDCMAWSHTDGLSVHDATSAISLFSAPGLAHHNHHPVLNGWEEIELEDIGPSFDYQHQQQQQHQYRAGNWSNSDLGRTEI
ncbi:hypothetical protein LPJ57_000275 [Coemansia sp. RSA 486]|nr:hypothetical protein LPJ57_000275 [Coemansia sp. RSA 486]